MPPRLRPSNVSSLTLCPPLRPQSLTPSSQASREFSQSSCLAVTRRRQNFYDWLNGPGAGLKRPLRSSTNYLGAYDRYGKLIRQPPDYDEKMRLWETRQENAEKGDALDEAVRASEEPPKLPPESAEDLRPFPMNRFFRSQPVLSEELREAIWQRVVRDGTTVSLASVEFGVSNERVGAVVRLKQMEKEWAAKGKKLAIRYSKGVLDMLPTTPYVDPKLPENKGKRPVIHESINDLIVHPATRQQLFVPVSESRQFTREDAGKAFDNDLLPADERIPHPELVQAEREIVQGLSFSERQRLAEERLKKEEEKKKAAERRRQQELDKMTRVPGRRWDFVFQDVSVQSVGQDGRNPRGVGWRYGFPHEDRKKGQIKIPRKVEA